MQGLLNQINRKLKKKHFNTTGFGSRVFFSSNLC